MTESIIWQGFKINRHKMLQWATEKTFETNEKIETQQKRESLSKEKDDTKNRTDILPEDSQDSTGRKTEQSV